MELIKLNTPEIHKYNNSLIKNQKKEHCEHYQSKVIRP